MNLVEKAFKSYRMKSIYYVLWCSLQYGANPKPKEILCCRPAVRNTTGSGRTLAMGFLLWPVSVALAHDLFLASS